MSTIYKSVDVLVVGAGLSGIGGACQLQRHSPDKSLPFLRRVRPAAAHGIASLSGIRSDSDMFTYAYGFKPWTDKSSIADGHKILSYIREAAQDYDMSAIFTIVTKSYRPSGHRQTNIGWWCVENRYR